jgi:6-phosphogluconolactonase (cycloisomerase 2 family)
MAYLKVFLSAVLATPALAQLLYATSYNDHALTTLQLDGSSLKTVSRSYDCGSEPTWLTLDYANSVLYCLNEGWGGNSTITSYKTSAAGALTTLDILPTLKSPVASTLYGPENSGLAVAYYDTSSFGTFSVGNPKDLAQTFLETYTLAAPGPVPDRQDVPHLHDAILDPTKNFILVPDLGSDFIRIYKIGAKNVTELTPIKAIPGSGPRHGAFAVVGKKTFFYNVNELSNTITGYSVSYKNSNPEFTRLFDFSTHGPGGSVPAGTKAAEIVVSVRHIHPHVIPPLK